jgi:hypothetical protein
MTFTASHTAGHRRAIAAQPTRSPIPKEVMSEANKDGRTSGGVPVTDELVQQLADEAEAGYDLEGLRRCGGRGPLGSGPADVVPVRVDPELRAALAVRANAEHISSSDVIR